MTRKLILLITTIGVVYHAQAQRNPALPEDSTGAIRYGLSIGAIATSNDQVPFWMRSNQYGSIPVAGLSTSLEGFAERGYKKDDDDKIIDWGAGFDLRGNVGNPSQLILVESYLKARLSIFQIKAGRSRDYMGIADPELSSGNFAISGNAPGIPKVEISIPEYWDLPLTKKLIAVKGNFSYGWMGNTRLLYTPNDINHVNSYFHQKSLYVRIGKPDSRLKLYGGFSHQVMWGNEKQIFGKPYTLSKLQSFEYAVFGKTYGNSEIPYSKIGNHIGSIDQAIEYDFPKFGLKFYHEFFYEVGGLYHLTNIDDGLWGISIKNKSNAPGRISLKNLVVEFLSSKDQGGGPNAKITPSGDEDYYNNSLYYQGWSYEGENIGSNFMTNKKYIRQDLPLIGSEYIGNNRIIMLHIALSAAVYDWTIVAKVSGSRNYGTYGSSPYGNTTGDLVTIQPPPYFTEASQISAYFEASRALKKGFRIGFAVAGDYGDLLYNSVGGMVRLSKTW